MTARRQNGGRRTTRRVMAGAALAAGLFAATAGSAQAATTATFSGGVLSVFGDSLDNSIAISRNTPRNAPRVRGVAIGRATAWNSSRSSRAPARCRAGGVGR